MVLQAQINPHFLYNTLDSIYWYSLSDRQRDIGNVVQHLAKMLRIALSKGSEYIPVERELQHVANYLEIESTIYQGRFTYEVEADPAVMSCTVLKILLQPLAENSITHGFANMERGGHIRVQVGQDADDLVLSVTDNGLRLPAGGTHRRAYVRVFRLCAEKSGKPIAAALRGGCPRADSQHPDGENHRHDQNTKKRVNSEDV